MKELIIVAGKRKTGVCRLRRFLREKGYQSIPCKTAEQIIEEIEILLTCDATVPLVIIESEILNDISDDLIARLTDFALDVPFLMFNDLDVEADLMDVFERICEYRAQFQLQQNLELSEALKEAGVELIYS